MKAVLVLDMPNDCDECPLNSHTDYDFDVCWVTQGKGECPLRPLPRRMSMRDEAEFYLGYMNGKTKYLGFNEGYNACLEDITGDTE